MAKEDHRSPPTDLPLHSRQPRPAVAGSGGKWRNSAVGTLGSVSLYFREQSNKPRSEEVWSIYKKEDHLHLGRWHGPRGTRCNQRYHLGANARNRNHLPISAPYRAGKSLQFWVANMFAAPVRRSGKWRVPLMMTGESNRRDAPNSTSQYSL